MEEKDLTALQEYIRLAKHRDLQVRGSDYRVYTSNTSNFNFLEDAVRIEKEQKKQREEKKLLLKILDL